MVSKSTTTYQLAKRWNRSLLRLLAQHSSYISQPPTQISAKASNSPHFAIGNIRSNSEANLGHQFRVPTANRPMLSDAPPYNAILREKDFGGHFEASRTTWFFESKESKECSENEPGKVQHQRRIEPFVNPRSARIENLSQ